MMKCHGWPLPPLGAQRAASIIWCRYSSGTSRLESKPRMLRRVRVSSMNCSMSMAANANGSG